MIEEKPGAFERERDAATIRYLEEIGVYSGWQCLEVGGGAGTIAEWLCQRVETAGHVVATDLDTRLLEAIASPNIEVRRHNIVNDDLEIDFYDLVHARYVLLHLKEWEEVLKKLIDSLKPGGWLFIEDPDLDEMICDPATEDADRAIIDRHFDAVKQMMSKFGMDMKFGSNTLKAFKDHGLESLKSESSSQVVFGGSPIAELFRTSPEMKDRLISFGSVTGEDIDEFTERTNKPTFLFRSMRTVFTLGRKPSQF
jgi:SAM-dependent methyltransferase